MYRVRYIFEHMPSSTSHTELNLHTTELLLNEVCEADWPAHGSRTGTNFNGQYMPSKCAIKIIGGYGFLIEKLPYLGDRGVLF